ncbi:MULTISPECIES: UbiA family prenyltransferase [Rhodomicrobium]|uniref:UbiA family prenyltransferase n=1 Tax=Rhodomicrobium TaxID=1068 RepID=UPI001AECC78F|nr:MULTISPECIES: UbiA family prenyltransferase [Rhodomicrobium]
MNWLTALRLGRVSNLPTVWTNALAGIVLSAGHSSDSILVPLLIGLSLLYVSGMYLNDAFDAEIDARERSSRPIPQGEVAAGTVFAAGFSLMAVGLVCLATLGSKAFLMAILLAGAIVLYDWLHKGTALAPLLMALCRALVYGVAAAAAYGASGEPLLIGAIGLFCYITGLTYAAKQGAFDRVERLWPLAVMAVPLAVGTAAALDRPQALPFFAAFVIWTGGALWLLWRRRQGDVGLAISRLIAGISLYDAILVGAYHSPALGLLCALAVPVTIAAQKFVPGT